MPAAGHVNGLDTILRNLNGAIDDIEGGTIEGLLAGGLIIERTAKRYVPVLTGNLKNSGYTRKVGPRTVEVGFSAAYAVFVHENLEARHRNGQSKYLQRAVVEKRTDVLEQVQRRAKV